MKKDEFVELDKIAKQEKLPEEEKQKITRIALDNLINAISIMTYLIVLMLLPLIKKQMFSITIYKTASMIILFLSIFIFEKAYKCDSGKLTISGIEVLILAIITLFAQYGFLKMQYTFLQLAGVYYGVYYIIKTIVLSVKIKRNYRKTVSDISEIVKKESKDKKAEETKIVLILKVLYFFCCKFHQVKHYVQDFYSVFQEWKQESFQKELSLWKNPPVLLQKQIFVMQ